MELWQLDVVGGFALADGTTADHARPHQSLGDATPDSRFHPSRRHS
jgi:hypothetical protein